MAYTASALSFALGNLGKPVIFKGITQMQLYEVGSKALKYGAIPGNDMTIEAVTTKLMWMLAQTRNLKEIKKAFRKNYFGEVTV